MADVEGSCRGAVVEVVEADDAGADVGAGATVVGGGGRAASVVTVEGSGAVLGGVIGRVVEGSVVGSVVFVAVVAVAVVVVVVDGRVVVDAPDGWVVVEEPGGRVRGGAGIGSVGLGRCAPACVVGTMSADTATNPAMMRTSGRRGFTLRRLQLRIPTIGWSRRHKSSEDPLGFHRLAPSP